MTAVRETPGKQALYITLLTPAFSVAFINTALFPISAVAAIACIIFVVMFIHSDRKQQSRKRNEPRGFAVIVEHDAAVSPCDDALLGLDRSVEEPEPFRVENLRD